MADTDKDGAWVPGCGRKHPNYDLIMEWAQGKVAKVSAVKAMSSIPVQQQYPCWNPNSTSYSAVGRDSFHGNVGYHFINDHVAKRALTRTGQGSLL